MFSLAISHDEKDSWEYLINKDEWIKILSRRIENESLRSLFSSKIRQIIDELDNDPQRLEQCKTEIAAKKIPSDFFSKIGLKDFNILEARHITACFIATIARKIIMQGLEEFQNNVAETRKRFFDTMSFYDNKQVSIASEYLTNTLENPNEIDRMSRFEAAIKIIKGFVQSEALIGTFPVLHICFSAAILLEGSSPAPYEEYSAESAFRLGIVYHFFPANRLGDRKRGGNHFYNQAKSFSQRSALSKMPIDELNRSIVEGLMDNEKWIEMLKICIENNLISAQIIPKIEEMMNDLDKAPERLQEFQTKIFTKGAENGFLTAVQLPDDLYFSERKSIEACFLATIIRKIIIQDSLEVAHDKLSETKETSFMGELSNVVPKAEDFLDHSSSLALESNQKIDDLPRFKRVIEIIRPIIEHCVARNQGLIFLVASLIEGPDHYVHWSESSSSTPEQIKKRKEIVLQAFNIESRKRQKKSTQENNALTENNPLPAEIIDDINKTLRNYMINPGMPAEELQKQIQEKCDCFVLSVERNRGNNLFNGVFRAGLFPKASTMTDMENRDSARLKNG